MPPAGQLSGLRFAALLVAIASSPGCSDATVRIVAQPRFVHEDTDPIPTARTNTYPATFDADIQTVDAACVARGKRIAGFDFEMQFVKEEGPFADRQPDDDERFFQSMETRTVVDDNCLGARVVQEQVALEYFHRARNYDVQTQHICNEMYFTYTVNATAGLVDLDDIPNGLGGMLPAVNTGQNVAALGHQDRSFTQGAAPPPFHTVLSIGLSPADIHSVTDTLNSVDRDSVVTWELAYEFNGCGVAPGYHQQCNNVHCWRLRYTDSEVTNREVIRNED